MMKNENGLFFLSDLNIQMVFTGDDNQEDPQKSVEEFKVKLYGILENKTDIQYQKK